MIAKIICDFAGRVAVVTRGSTGTITVFDFSAPAPRIESKVNQ
jgi:hypothetical protein